MARYFATIPKKYIETNDPIYSLVGNAPILINKNTKQSFRLGTYLDIGLDQYEREVLGWNVKWKLVLKSDLSQNDKIKLIYFLKTKLCLSSAESLNFINRNLIFDTLSYAKEAQLLIKERASLFKIIDK
jgi:hypothetical protein